MKKKCSVHGESLNPTCSECKAVWKRKTGTKEWAESNYNIGIGCSHDCRYCYARVNAERFHFISPGDSWTTERVKEKQSPITKKGGTVMFPTTHDITPYYLPSAVKALRELLTKGNNVLIVSKPHLECIDVLCREFVRFKKQILFRFTIGTCLQSRAKLWEPGAPPVVDRLACLMMAYEQGFATSVSMEPMLGDITDAVETFESCAPYVTDKIWLGKMNKIDRRVKKSSPEIAAACEKIKEWQSDENILLLVERFKDHPKVAWKDSIKEVIEAHENRVL